MFADLKPVPVGAEMVEPINERTLLADYGDKLGGKTRIHLNLGALARQGFIVRRKERIHEGPLLDLAFDYERIASRVMDGALSYVVAQARAARPAGGCGRRLRRHAGRRRNQRRQHRRGPGRCLNSAASKSCTGTTGSASSCRSTPRSSPWSAPTDRARPRCSMRCARCWQSKTVIPRATTRPTCATTARAMPGCAPWSATVPIAAAAGRSSRSRTSRSRWPAASASVAATGRVTTRSSLATRRWKCWNRAANGSACAITACAWQAPG